MMRIDIKPLPLQLHDPFTVSYGTSTVRENVLVRLSDGVNTGLGEAAVVPYYGETPARVSAYLADPALADVLDNAQGDVSVWLEDALDRLPPSESASARAAVDMALHDLWAKRLGHPLYRLWGLNPARSPRSSFTVAMTDGENEYRRRLRAARGYCLIKLKLGSGDPAHDLDFVRIAREELDVQLCVDANGGWSAADALVLISELTRYELAFIEQPVARDDWEGWRALREGLPDNHPPLLADESVQGVASVSPLAGLVDGINIKLAKCGGLRAARQMIALARAYDMRVMVGCMVESSVAVTAAAHLAPLADFADLDGNLLVSNDPYQGVVLHDGVLSLPDRAGLGVISVG